MEVSNVIDVGGDPSINIVPKCGLGREVEIDFGKSIETVNY
jgi:hypothetical protein